MNVKPNIGTVNALLRITCGLTMLAWSTAKLSRKPGRSLYLMTAMMGAMKVGEGIVKYCPVTDLMLQSTEMARGEGKDSSPF
ncbi:DUF2892 domain-containing protein [Peribacillus sp. SCS-26]|uniref:YgaP family membrane protein n=1 Tax=Paraperibacillus marinus TaxID=3115295 RepID=UPI0039059243